MKNSNLFSSVVIKWGLIYGLIGVIYVFLSAMLGLQGQGNIAIGIGIWLFTVGLAFLMYFLATKEYRGENGNLISFGRGFGINMLVGLIGGAIRGVGFYFYAKVIDPSYVQNLIDAQMEAQEKFGGQSASSAEVPAFVKFLQTAEFMAGSTFLFVIFGAVIFGLIVAAIIQKKEELTY
jgi:protein-S-isoprenylcysteine O-methyltransferase Ste14